MAGKRITGITIEINGETTKLQSALKNVDSQLSKTQTALKDVNKLLKLDPSNTDLLSQKQKLLSQAISETKQRLDTLKTTNEQVTKTLGNYEAWKQAYTPIQEEITKTKDKIKSLKDKMSELNEAGKVDTSEYKALGEELKKEENHLKDLRQQAKEVSDEFGNPISHEQYDALQREIIETEQQLKSLEKQAKSSSSILGTQMQEAGKKISETGEKISSAGKKLIPASTAIVGIGVASVKTASDFEYAMSDVAATMGTTKDNIQDLSDKAREMGETTEFSATEAAQGLNILAMSGLDAKEQIATIEPVLNLASAGTLSLESAASYATGAIKGFRDSCDNARYYTDLMAKGATLANTDVNGLGEALSGSAAMAKSYGQSADSVTLSLLRLAEQNVVGAEATTALNRAMADLYTPTDAAKKALDELKVSAYNADGSARDMNDVIDELNAALSDMTDEEANAYKNTIFTTQGLSAFNKMTSTSKDKVNEFKEGLASASDGIGSAAEQAQTKLDNLKGQLTILQSAVSEAAISIGEVLAPIIKDIVAKIQEWTDKFNSLDEKQKKIIVTIGAIAAAIGPVLVILGTLISSVGTITGAIGKLITFLTPAAAETAAVGTAATGAAGGVGILSSGLLPIVGIIAGVVTAGVLLYKNWDTIEEKAGQLKEKVSEKVSAMEENITSKYSEIKQNSKKSWEGMKQDMSANLSAMLTAYKTHGGGLKGAVSAALTGIKGIYSTQYNAIDTLTGGKLSAISSKFSSTMSNAKKTVSDAISNIRSKFDFSWSLPKLKLPHISISGKFGINPPSVPHFGISWYDKAMNAAYVLNGASIFGSLNGNLLGGGESGTEMVMGKQYLINMIQKASAQSNDAVIDAVNSIGARMISIMSQYFPQFATNKQVVMDTGTLVGEIAPKIDMQLGRIADHKGRGI